MKIFNSLTMTKQEFVPIEPGKVRMYVCGPTVYNLIHIGNARPMIVFDTVRRYLEHRGYEVNYVSNFTDVDDKIIKAAVEEGVTAEEIAERYIAECKKDMEAMNVRPATTHPLATKEIPGMIEMIGKLIEKGLVSVNGRAVTSKKCALSAGDTVVIDVPEPEILEVRAEDIPLDIVYEDDDVAVIDKPRGMVVHPGPGNYSGTLVNAVMYRMGDSLSSINGVIRPGIVHRIDKDTSGLLMIAKNDMAHESLAAQLKEHSVTREYTALACDNIREDELTIDAPIGRDPGNRMRNAVGGAAARNAVTHIKVLERFGRYTLVKAVLETGRTHQIRVHMAYIRHPLAGDELYGPGRKSSKVEGIEVRGQLLHAGTLGFIHPSTGDYMEFHSPLPEVFEAVLEKLRK